MKHTLHTISLDGGAQLLAINTPGARSMQFNTLVRAGWDYINAKQFELPHLLEHLAFQGNKQYPSSQEFSFDVEKNGAYMNAHTSEYMIHYDFEASIYDLQDITKLACSQIDEPLFNEEAITAQKQVVTSELSRKLEDDGNRCGYKMTQILKPILIDFQDRIKTLNAITRDDIVSYFNQTHVKENLCFVVAADFSDGRLQLLESQLNTFLKSYRSGNKKSITYNKPNDYKKVVVSQKTKLVTQDTFNFSLISNVYEKRAVAVTRIFNVILNGGSSSRLFTLARDKGLSYGVGTVRGINKDYSYYEVYDATEPEKALPLFDLCLSQIKDVLNGNITQKELERAIGFSAGRVELAFETPADLANWYGTDFSREEDMFNPNEFVKDLRSVTINDIKALYGTYIKDGQWLISLVGNKTSTQKADYKKIAEKYFG